MNKVLSWLLRFFAVIGLWIVLTLPQVPLTAIIYGKKGFTEGQSFIVIGAFLLAILFYIWLARKQKVLDTDKKLDLRTLVLSVGVGYGSIILTNIIGTLIMTVEGANNTANQSAIEEMAKSVPLGVLFVMIVLGAPIMEELLFRGFVPKFLFKNKVLGLAIGSLLFALSHGPTNIGSFVLYAGMSAVLAVVVYKTDNILYSISLHAFNNFIGFLVIAFLQK